MSFEKGAKLKHSLHGFARFPDPLEQRLLPEVLPGLHWQPLVDLLASEEIARLCVDLPGVPPGEMRVVVSGCSVRVSGQRPLPALVGEPAGLDYRFAEILYGSFERSVELPWEADPGEVQSAYRDGLLVVQIGRRRASHERG